LLQVPKYKSRDSVFVPLGTSAPVTPWLIPLASYVSSYDVFEINPRFKKLTIMLFVGRDSFAEEYGTAPAGTRLTLFFAAKTFSGVINNRKKIYKKQSKKNVLYVN